MVAKQVHYVMHVKPPRQVIPRTHMSRAQVAYATVFQASRILVPTRNSMLAHLQTDRTISYTSCLLAAGKGVFKKNASLALLSITTTSSDA